MFESNLDHKGKKEYLPTETYNLSLDRRVNPGRRKKEQATFTTEHRVKERRRDNRPLDEFPYLP